MKITSCDGPFYWRRFYRSISKITLDGEQIWHATMADDVEGVVEFTRRDEGGGWVKNAAGDALEVFTRRGKVEIIGELREQAIV